MELKYIIESILFAHGDPVRRETIAEVTGRSSEEVTAALDALMREYEGKGLTLLYKDNEVQLGTHPENTTYLERLFKKELGEELSRSALETLAIVAYHGPLTRAAIEYMRGVNSSFTLRNLLMRGLVERLENPQDARSFLYRVSFDFLKHFGIKRIEDLPEYGALRKRPVEEIRDAAETPSPEAITDLSHLG